jgi:hypothetical protein
MRITEISVDLRPDGRSRPPHLRSFRDGWRHLRFMLLFSPLWLFIIPGMTLLLLGILLSVALVGGTVWVGKTGFGIHTLLVAGMLGVVGEQLLLFGAFTQKFAVIEGIHPPSQRLDWLTRRFRLELGLAIGAILCVLGLCLLLAATAIWWRNEFGPLDPADTMRLVIPACVSLMAGVQTMFGSFVLSVLQLPRSNSRGTANSGKSSTRLVDASH